MEGPSDTMAGGDLTCNKPSSSSRIPPGPNLDLGNFERPSSPPRTLSITPSVREEPPGFRQHLEKLASERASKHKLLHKKRGRRTRRSPFKCKLDFKQDLGGLAQEQLGHQVCGAKVPTTQQNELKVFPSNPLAALPCSRLCTPTR